MDVKNMIAWRAALSRTGGTVCEAIVKHLFQQAGYTCKLITLDDLKPWHELGATSDAHQSNLAFLEPFQEGPYLGGSGSFFTPLFHSPVFRVIFVRRDLRQALASFKRMTKMPSSEIPATLNVWMDVYEKCMTLPSVQCLVLDYDTEILPLLPAVNRLSGFLGISLSEKCLEETAAKYNRNTMRSNLHSRAAEALECLRNLRTRKCETCVPIEIHDFDQREAFQIPLEAFDVTTQERLKKGQTCTELRIALPDGASIILPLSKDGSCRLGPFSPSAEKSIENQATGHFHLDHIASTNQDWSAAFTKNECVQINRQLAAFLEKHGFELQRT